MKKKILIGVFIFFIALLAYIGYLFRNRSAVTEFFVSKICDENILDRYNASVNSDQTTPKEEVLDVIELYQEISKDFSKYNIDKYDLSFLAKKPVYPYISMLQTHPIALRVKKNCPSESNTTRNVALFVSEMYFLANGNQSNIDGAKLRLRNEIEELKD